MGNWADRGGYQITVHMHEPGPCPTPAPVRVRSTRKADEAEYARLAAIIGTGSFLTIRWDTPCDDPDRGRHTYEGNPWL
jgi:hypothetical protein